MILRTLAAFALATAAFTPALIGADSTTAEEARAYPLTTCLASGAALPSEPVVIVHDGQTYKFANEEAAAPYRADPARMPARLAELQAAAGE